MLIIAGKMFTTGRIIFSLLFVVAFVALLVISYRKDGSNHKKYYKHGALQVAGILIVLIILLYLAKVFLRG